MIKFVATCKFRINEKDSFNDFIGTAFPQRDGRRGDVDASLAKKDE